MNFLLFFYNIILTIFLIAICLGLVYIYIKRKGKFEFWLLCIFGLFLMDEFFVYMMEAIPGFFDEVSVAVTSNTMSYRDIVGIVLALLYREALYQYFERRTSAGNRLVWMLYLLMMIPMSCLATTPTLMTIRDLLMLLVVGTVWIIGLVFLKKDREKHSRNENIRLAVMFISGLVGYTATSVNYIYWDITGHQMAIRSIPVELFTVICCVEAIIYIFIHWPKGNDKMADSDEAVAEKLAKQYDLTKREYEILVYLLNGDSYQEISEQAFISLGTVKTHVHHIYQKFGINQRSQIRKLIE